jgi:hypothetical protein
MNTDYKTMLITGTTQGIGYQLYKYYKDKYNIITINRQDIGDNNYVCDLSNMNEVRELISQIASINVDILINNAGGASPVHFLDMTIDELIAVSTLNYHTPILLMQAVINGMVNRGYGKIINISSIGSKSPRPLIAHYGAAKSALEKFSSSIAVAYGGTGVSVNCICPGGINTKTSIENRKKMAELLNLEKSHFNLQMAEKNGLGHLIDPQKVVDMVDFLLNDDTATISGQTFNVCGIREVH